MKVREFLAELARRNPRLYRFGLFNIGLLLLAFGMFWIDDTMIMGINAWIKPMKFAISITVYSWTFAWLLYYLPNPKEQNRIAWLVIICMTVEIGLIYMQAFRGVSSHFNVTSAFNGIVFSTMGMFILINSFAILYTIILFFIRHTSLDPTMLWAWRIGLIFFFLAGISGGIMSAILHHSVGVADGGPGLPLLNWSTVAGDIRSAHFFTLHGLQIFPLGCYFFSLISPRAVKPSLAILIVGYGAFCIWAHWIAFKGIPIIAIS